MPVVKRSEEHGLTFDESEKELLEAALRAQDGDETALAVLPEYLNYSLEKRDRVAFVLRRLDDDIAYFDKEIKRLQIKKARREKAKDKLETRTIYTMRDVGVDHVEGRTSSLTICKNPPSVFVRNMDEVPAKFKRVTTEVTVDKKQLAQALKDGEKVPGAELVTDKVNLRVG